MTEIAVENLIDGAQGGRGSVAGAMALSEHIPYQIRKRIGMFRDLELAVLNRNHAAEQLCQGNKSRNCVIFYV